MARLVLIAFLACSGWLVSASVIAANELPTFEIIAKDGRLFPERLDVPAGQRIKLVIRNQGKAPIEFENLGMRVEKVLAPGANSFVVLPKLKPGEYEFIDEFHMDTGKMKVIAK